MISVLIGSLEARDVVTDKKVMISRASISGTASWFFFPPGDLTYETYINIPSSVAEFQRCRLLIVRHLCEGEGKTSRASILRF